MEQKQRTRIMGILNVTPDSFSDGGRFAGIDAALAKARAMIDEGADIIDVGGESTRPGARPVSAEEELQRVQPVIAALRRERRTAEISVDTSKAAVANAALGIGAPIVNSVGGFLFDAELAHVAADHRAHVVLCHVGGSRRSASLHERSPHGDIVTEVMAFFNEQIDIGLRAGLAAERFILDPGIGFGKTFEQNMTLLRELGALRVFGLPILIGVSRKSHLAALLSQELGIPEPGPLERLEAGLAEAAIAVAAGASIVRTHDCAQTKRFFAAFDALRNKETV